MSYVQAYIDWVALGAAALALVAFVLCLWSLIANGRLKKKFRKWKAIHATADLDTVYERTVNEVESLRRELLEAQNEMVRLRDQLRQKVSTVQVMRYNAFAETGSDLSFSAAFLDDEQTGVVISSIYGREESRTYAKPIQKGSSNYTLTEEEVAVLGGTKNTTTGRRSVNV